MINIHGQNAMVYQTVHCLLQDKTDMEDVIQEVYVQLHKSLPSFDLNRPFRPWLMGIVIRPHTQNGMPIYVFVI